MPRLTQSHLKDVLTRELKLERPEFHLLSGHGRVSGWVVDSRFRGKDSGRRQRMIREALERALAPRVVEAVGIVLALTPDEWELGPGSDNPPPGSGWRGHHNGNGRNGRAAQSRA